MLAVGAGHEAVLYWLANRVGRVLATDIYGEGDFAGGEADDAMLSGPLELRALPLPPRAARGRRAWTRGGLELATPASTSSSRCPRSSTSAVARTSQRAARELGRVLRPGGHAFVVTECFVESSLLDRPRVHNLVRIVSAGRLAATARSDRRGDRRLHRRRGRRADRRALGPAAAAGSPQLGLSLESLANVATFKGGERPEPATGRWHPHIALQARIGSPWTSIALAHRSPGRRSAHPPEDAVSRARRRDRRAPRSRPRPAPPAPARAPSEPGRRCGWYSSEITGQRSSRKRGSRQQRPLGALDVDLQEVDARRAA